MQKVTIIRSLPTDKAQSSGRGVEWLSMCRDKKTMRWPHQNDQK